MWCNNSGDSEIDGGSNKSFFKILNCHENIDQSIIFPKLRQVKLCETNISRTIKGRLLDGYVTHDALSPSWC